MAQRVEKVAQRRLEERSEKIKSARKTRFDMKLNPFFSRPLASIAKEFVRQQQEQQQQQSHPNDQNKPIRSSPTHPIILSQSHDFFSPYSFVSQESNQPIRSPRRVIKRSKNFNNSIDDHENGLPSTITVAETSALTNIKQPIIRSPSHRQGITDATMLKSINRLKLIFPGDHQTKYRSLMLLDNISYIYIQLVVATGNKTMTGGQFRHFAR